MSENMSIQTLQATQYIVILLSSVEQVKPIFYLHLTQLLYKSSGQRVVKIIDWLKKDNIYYEKISKRWQYNRFK